MVFNNDDIRLLKAATVTNRISHNILTAVLHERSYQDAKWGTLKEHPHEVGSWIAIMRRELREADDAWCSARGDEGALQEILQVIAVGFACLEQHGVIEREQV